LSYDKKLYNFQRHTSDKNRTTTVLYDFYRSSDISFTIYDFCQSVGIGRYGRKYSGFD